MWQSDWGGQKEASQNNYGICMMVDGILAIKEAFSFSRLVTQYRLMMTGGGPFLRLPPSNFASVFGGLYYAHGMYVYMYVCVYDFLYSYTYMKIIISNDCGDGGR